MVPELEKLQLDWIEEPFAIGDDYVELRSSTNLRIAAGELFWGTKMFQEILTNKWVDVIMPDVKHVGGFGPLVRVLEMADGRIEVSPHNPAGPVSTAATLHAAVLYPNTVKTIEFAFDPTKSRKKYGEVVTRGSLYLLDRVGWGVDPLGR